MRRLPFLVLLAACGGPPAPARATVDVAPPSSASPAASAPRPLAPPAGEQWVSPDDAERVTLARVVRATSAPMAAKVVIDETRTVQVRAKVAGLVTAVPVAVGRRVKAGDTLVIVESGGRKSSLPSPRAGEVVSIAVEAGNAVTAKAALVVVSDTDVVLVVAAPVPPSVIAGTVAAFRVEAFPDKVFMGKVDSLSSDREARVKMANNEGWLRPGMVGMVRLDAEVEGFGLPRAALRNAGRSVLIKRGRTPDGFVRFVETSVSVVFDGGAPFVAIAGVNEGDEVVVGGIVP